MYFILAHNVMCSCGVPHLLLYFKGVFNVEAGRGIAAETVGFAETPPLWYIFPMTAIQQTVEIDSGRRILRLETPLPESINTGRADIVLVIQNEVPTSPVRERIGFMKGEISCPADFDTMGREEITALFAGNT